MVKVFINAGHSLTSDSGAVNPRLGLKEAQVVNAIGLSVEKQLKELGIQTSFYQQKKSLNEVFKEANKSESDIFISIHMNAPAITSGGVEVLYCEGSTKGKDYAQTILKHIVKIEDYTFKNRGVKDDSNRHLGVLRQTKMLACLVEMGFITYDKEAKFVNEHTISCAKAIVNGIVEYLIKIKKLTQEEISMAKAKKPTTAKTETAKTETKPQQEKGIKIVPSGKNDTFNLFIDGTMKLKENRIETVHSYLLVNFKDKLYS